MNRYRFTLGKTVDTTTNLVTNGKFTGSLAGWTAGTHWTSVANQAKCLSAAPSLDLAKCKLTQTGLFKLGEIYWIQFDLKATGDFTPGYPGRLTYSIGGTYYDYINVYDDNPTTTYITYTHEKVICAHGTSLEFFCGAYNNLANCYLDNVIVYPYQWNSPLTYDPVNWDEAKITKKRDEVLNGLIIEYIADLTFIEDGYDYLYAQYLANGFCEEIDIKIEKLDINDNYQPFFTGSIFIDECKFNTTKRQVSVNIVNSGATQLFIKNKDVRSCVKDNLSGYAVTNNVTISPACEALININDNGGNYVNPNIVSYDVSKVLRRLIMVSTNYRVDCSSSFFTSGTFNHFCITTGQYLRLLTEPSIDFLKLSVNELFTELNKLFNLTFSLDTSAAIPVIKIESKISYFSSTPVLSLSLVNDVEFVFDKKNIVKTLNTGYELIDYSPTETFLNNEKGEQYLSDGFCPDGELNLVSKYIQKPTVIWFLLDATITSTKYDEKWVWLETDGTQSTNGGAATYLLNPNIETPDNVLRQISTLQSDFLKVGEPTSNKIIKPNAAFVAIYGFDYPLTKAQFDSIAQAYNTIQFDTDGTGNTTKDGFLLQGDFKIKTGLTEFKLLSD